MLPWGEKTSTSVLSQGEEGIITEFRKITQLSLDDTLYALQESIPHLTRSNLYRCLKRNECSRLQKTEETKLTKKPFKYYPIGFFHVDIAEVRTAEGKLYLFVAIDRTSKFTYARLYQKSTRKEAGDFLRNLVEIVPYKIHKILTDNGIQFISRANSEERTKLLFDEVCKKHKIEHLKTKVKHPWTNGMVERMNRILKEARVKSFYYQTHEELEIDLLDFLRAYNFARRLKMLHGKTPWQFVQEEYQKTPERFKEQTLQNYAELNKPMRRRMWWMLAVVQGSWRVVSGDCSTIVLMALR